MQRKLMMLVLSCLLVLGLASSATTAQKHVPNMIGIWDVSYTYVTSFGSTGEDPVNGSIFPQYAVESCIIDLYSQQDNLFFGRGAGYIAGVISDDTMHMALDGVGTFHGKFIPGTESIEGYIDMHGGNSYIDASGGIIIATFTMTKRP